MVADTIPGAGTAAPPDDEPPEAAPLDDEPPEAAPLDDAPAEGAPEDDVPAWPVPDALPAPVFGPVPGPLPEPGPVTGFAEVVTVTAALAPVDPSALPDPIAMDPAAATDPSEDAPEAESAPGEGDSAAGLAGVASLPAAGLTAASPAAGLTAAWVTKACGGTAEPFRPDWQAVSARRAKPPMIVAAAVVAIRFMVVPLGLQPPVVAVLTT